MQCCYALGNARMFFIANSSLEESLTVKANFNLDKGLVPWIWDPETGKKMRCPLNDDQSDVALELPRASSLLIVLDKDNGGEVYQPVPVHADGEEIAGAWQLTLNHINGSEKQLQMDRVTDLTEMEETRDFAGTVIYETTFVMNGKERRFIDLGDVQGITELSLNGKLLGTRWYGAHVYDIREAVKPGENRLSVKLTTIVGNYLRTLKDNPVARRWVVYQPNIPMGILGPVKLI